MKLNNMSNYLLLSKLLCIAVTPEAKSERYVYLQEKRRRNLLTGRYKVVRPAGFYELVQYGFSRSLENEPLDVSSLSKTKYRVAKDCVFVNPDVTLFDVVGESWRYYFPDLESANDFKNRVLKAVQQGAVAIDDKGEIIY